MHAPCDQLYLFSTLLEGGQFHLLLTAQTSLEFLLLIPNLPILERTLKPTITTNRKDF